MTFKKIVLTAALLATALFAEILDWQSNTTYNTGDSLNYMGDVYVAQRFVYQNTPPKESDKGWFWKEITDFEVVTKIETVLTTVKNIEVSMSGKVLLLSLTTASGERHGITEIYGDESGDAVEKERFESFLQLLNRAKLSEKTVELTFSTDHTSGDSVMNMEPSCIGIQLH